MLFSLFGRFSLLRLSAFSKRSLFRPLIFSALRSLPSSGFFQRFILSAFQGILALHGISPPFAAFHGLSCLSISEVPLPLQSSKKLTLTWREKVISGPIGLAGISKLGAFGVHFTGKASSGKRHTRIGAHLLILRAEETGLSGAPPNARRIRLAEQERRNGRHEGSPAA